MTMPTVITIEGVELNAREWEAAKYILSCLTDENYPHPPSYTELAEALKRRLGQDINTSQQLQRIVKSLRSKGILINPAKLPKNARNQKLLRRPNMIIRPEWRPKIEQAMRTS